MTALAVFCALAFFALLVSRVHFHFSFNLTISRRGSTGQIHASRSRAKIRRAEGGSDQVASALVNLGCKPQKAREVAKKAIEQGKDFESRVRWAIQNAA
jgi:hypothetical protein